MLHSRRNRPPLFLGVAFCASLLLVRLGAQQILGAITGTVKDATGASVPGVNVRARNTATNLEVRAETQTNGAYLLSNLPIGTYELSFTKEGFEKESHTAVVVQGDRTTTVDGSLQIGTTTTTVEVTASPLMNQVDTTNGYVVDQLTIEQTPLGTGSFTQLALLSPGVNADFLSGSGTNAGLGNQAIFANGQRDTSNSFSLNGVSTNNLFNGNSTSQVAGNRFVLNTGETFGAGGEIITATSVYSAIGEALPTPAQEMISEIRVDAAMYDATQGANSGAHIGVTTKSGTNDFHGEAYERLENNFFNATPFFYNSAGLPTPKLERNQFGATIGGPIVKNKLFFFVAYGGVRAIDALNGTQQDTVPIDLTSDRSAAALANVANMDFAKTNITAANIDPVALKLMQTKLPNGHYLIPNPTITDQNLANSLGYDALVQGPSSTFKVNQGVANADYLVNDKDRLSVKYFIQDDPTTNPFTAQSNALGFPQTLTAGSQVGAIQNTVILSPSLTWDQRVAFTRLYAYSGTQEAFKASDYGINLFGETGFPGIQIGTFSDNPYGGFNFGPATNFSNAGFYQNQWEYGSTLGWVKGRHTLSVGALWDHSQLNIENRLDQNSLLAFRTFTNFLEGQVRTGSDSNYFSGSSSRYYRSDTIGSFVNDNFKIASNLTLTMGLRWDYDGPLSEKYGRLTTFDATKYQYDAASDTILNSGLVVASNNAQFGTPGAGNSLMKNRQWGVAPRIGLAWSPKRWMTVRTGFGLYYDRGEFFTEFSPSAGGGYSGPFGVTVEPPFLNPISATKGATIENPFGTTAPTPPPNNPAAFLASLPNLAGLVNGNAPFYFGGYDPANKLPYSENWTFDLQLQPKNDWLVSIGYVGNHGLHGVLPIPFNQPGIATPQHPIHGEIYSYGFQATDPVTGNTSAYEPNYTWDGGNTDLRVPYIGYNPNSVFWKAEGISWYNALQVQVRKRYSNGLQFTASYTWSHSLDEQSGLGLFYNGNNPLDPKSGYASSDFDRTHVFLINYSYALPNLTTSGSQFAKALLNGWTIGGQTVAQSGQPYSVYDYSGAIAGIYFSSNDYITNPLVPLAPGKTAKSAQLQGTTGVNAGQPVLDPNAFAPQFLQPGQDGVPPCDSAGICDNYESVYGTSGRNLFRGPFQVRFDASLGKTFTITERVRARFNCDVFNLFNHPSFDTPNNDVTFFPNYGPPPSYPPVGQLGLIQHTLGSPRFMQLSLHLLF